MEEPKEPALDEIMWRSPADLERMGGAIHTNTVHHYFAASPFFDPTSNNAVLINQANYNQSMFAIMGTRVAFEERLRSMQGLEFMVTQDPSEGDTKLVNSGVWVLRKQIRRKRPGQQDDVMGLASYYVVGENIYMAPTVGSVISARLLSAATSLTKLLATASELPEFIPARGYTYPTPFVQQVGPKGQTSKESTPMQVAGTPRLNAPGIEQTTASGLASSGGTDYLDPLMFQQSWALALLYGEDYMDQNPLVGEPGAFKLTDKPDKLKFKEAKVREVVQPFKAFTKKPVAPPIKTDMPIEKEKKTTPGTGKMPITPGLKDKKGRRKSKAAGVATPRVTTPKPVTPG